MTSESPSEGATSAGATSSPAAAPLGGGVGYMVQAAFWFAVMAMLVKLAGERLPVLEVVFVRGCVTLAIGALALRRARLSPFHKAPGLLLLRGLVGSLALMCFYAAVVELPLAEATVIHQTAPVFTAVFAALWLGERIEARVLLGIVGALAGVVLIAQPDVLFGAPTIARTNPVPWLWALVALAGALLSAIAYVTVRRLGRSENPLVVVFYFPLVTVPLTAPLALPQWVWPEPTGWLLLLGVGTTTQIAQIALTKGLAREPAGRATAVGYLQAAFATLLGAVVFGAWPTPSSWTGMALIVASLLLATRRRR
jgi:drug/metabolite transporter (DMT)-like permease